MRIHIPSLIILLLFGLQSVAAPHNTFHFLQVPVLSNNTDSNGNNIGILTIKLSKNINAKTPLYIKKVVFTIAHDDNLKIIRKLHAYSQVKPLNDTVKNLSLLHLFGSDTLHGDSLIITGKHLLQAGNNRLSFHLNISPETNLLTKIHLTLQNITLSNGKEIHFSKKNT